MEREAAQHKHQQQTIVVDTGPKFNPPPFPGHCQCCGPNCAPDHDCLPATFLGDSAEKRNVFGCADFYQYHSEGEACGTCLYAWWCGPCAFSEVNDFLSPGSGCMQGCVWYVDETTVSPPHEFFDHRGLSLRRCLCWDVWPVNGCLLEGTKRGIEAKIHEFHRSRGDPLAERAPEQHNCEFIWPLFMYTYVTWWCVLSPPPLPAHIPPPQPPPPPPRLHTFRPRLPRPLK